MDALRIRRSEIVGTLVPLVSFICLPLVPISQVLRWPRLARISTLIWIRKASKASTVVALEL